MPVSKNYHHDRGDGVCAGCFASYPCGGYDDKSSLDSWVRDQEDKIQQEWKAEWEPIRVELRAIQDKYQHLGYYSLYRSRGRNCQMTLMEFHSRINESGMKGEDTTGTLVLNGYKAGWHYHKIEFTMHEELEFWRAYDARMGAKRDSRQAQRRRRFRTGTPIQRIG